MHITHSSKTFLVTASLSAPFTVKYEHYYFELTLLCEGKCVWVYVAICQTPLPALHSLALVSGASFGQEDLNLHCLNEYPQMYKKTTLSSPFPQSDSDSDCMKFRNIWIASVRSFVLRWHRIIQDLLSLRAIKLSYSFSYCS